ncbi:hypothetical protein BP6252_12729 [Coleophoma cylindrospora]|uniref:Velvet domain-containing protein n=1 Tax=Coleophoma cylindrospora TaxID=1849047 RepID=A0A3D8QCQ4_9HELO|nr:hypothetical protein BP6252_12729 [Coleophoma cylindrospora]
MSMTEPARGYTRPPPPSRPSFPPSLESSSPSEQNSTRMRLPNPPSLPPMSSLLREDPPPRYNQYYQQGPSHSLFGVTHPLQLSQQNPSASLQHNYGPSQGSEHELRASSYSSDERPSPTYEKHQSPPLLDRMGSKTQEEYGAPLAQRRQSRKISQRKLEDSAEKARMDNSSMAFQARYEDAVAAPANLDASPNLRAASKISPTVDESSRLSRPVPIARLLSDDQDAESSSTGPVYKIRVRQQPLAARACGFGERDRRVIDPPPILQLFVEDPNATAAELSELLRQPYSVVHCVLWNPLTDRDDTAMPGSTDKRQQRRLMGTLVASPFVGLDEHDVEGCFFPFPDLSVRTAGTYSLKFSLVVLDPKRMAAGNSVPVSATATSETFQVYNAKDFIGMRASTELTKRLKHQGCLISVKKGNTKTNAFHARGDDGDEEEEEDEDDNGSGLNKKAKRPKR